MALKSDMTFSLFLVVAVGYWAQQTEGATVQSIYTRIKAKKQTFLWTSILTMYKTELMCTIGCLWMGPECKSTFFDSSAGMCYYDPGNTDGEILADDLDLPNNTVYMSIKDTEYSTKYETHLTTFCSSGSARDYVIGQTGSLTPSYPHNVAPLVPAHNLDSVRFVTHDQTRGFTACSDSECKRWRMFEQSWSPPLPNLVPPRFLDLSAVVTFGEDKIWLAGGRNGPGDFMGTTETTFYNKLNDSFSAGPNLPDPIIGTTLVPISASEHLTFGGSHNTYSVSSSKIYSSETGLWRPTAGSPPGNMNYGCTGTKVKDSVGEDIVIATPGELLQALWKYQIATETWSVLPASQNVPIPIHLPYAFNVNNIIILINGLENYVDNLKVFSYDPRQSNPTWVEEATQQSIACPKGLATRHEVLIAARV